MSEVGCISKCVGTGILWRTESKELTGRPWVVSGCLIQCDVIGHILICQRGGMAISGGTGFRTIVNITTVPVSLSYVPDTIHDMKRNLRSCEKFSALANVSLIRAEA